jgi:penicillin-binding protein 2
MPGVYIASDYLRYYPEGKYMSNILGYLGRMNETQLSNLAPLGYLPTDLIGQMGIESAFEDILRGTRGRDIIEVTRSGRRVAHLEHIPPTPGHDIFLTVDSVLQRNIYYHIENTLIALMRSRLWAEGIDFAREILASTLRANNINSLLIMNADPAEFPASGIIRDFVLRHAESYAAVNPAINPDEAGSAAAYRTALNEFIGDNILSGRVAMNTVFEVMAEQGIFEMTDAEINSLARGHISSTNFLLNLIESRRLTPQMANVEPATGSAVITCVKTGGIIAAVNYPTFNANNFLPHLRDNDYIAKVNNDPTRPLFARAFREANAPGSTFKMITAVAGLDQGVLTPTTQIHDNVVFRDAGHPYVHCMGSHGSINVVTALEASCNYFFNRVAWNLGNRHGGRTLEGIATLNYYMTALGLGSPTGVEVTEAPMVTAGRNSHPRIASPALRTALGHAGQWTDGMTSHVSIGQGYNDYTATSMAKVMATLANGGTRIQMHLLDRTVAANGEITPFETVIEYQLDIEPTHLQAIRQGMYNVPFGSRGTGRGIFAGFPIPIALKSGTAEVMGRISHSSYGGFAPYDNPQIAVYVMMPHGDSRYMRASAGYVMRDILSEYFGLNHSPTPAQNGGIR